MANPALFEEYFRRADLDNDGRISGGEAVSFFQGANLPQVTLAKIWQFADQRRSGYLTRPEFYNALKLVTVAQTGRDLTPDIIQAALSNPLAAQIPAPRIAGLGAQSVPSYAPSSVPSLPSNAGSGGFPDQVSSGAGAPPRQWSSQPNTVAPNNSGEPSTIPKPGSVQGQKLPAGFSAGTWPSIKSSSGALAPPVSATPAPSHQAGQSVPAPGRKDAVPVQGYHSGSDNHGPGAGAAKPGSGILTSASVLDAFGGDAFAATPKGVAGPSSKSAPPSGLSQGFADFGDGGFRAQPLATAATSTSSQQPGSLAKVGLGPGYGQPQPAGLGSGAPWPRITPSDTQRYKRVFDEVDTDRDGKITGEQARDLFLSWRLPRDVLKQVWDLSDQDGDAMLSFREFCTALYLMERYREGRPLPPVLPSGVFGDEIQFSNYSNLGPGRIEKGRGPLSNSTPGYVAPGWQKEAGVTQPTSSVQPATNNRPLPPSAADRTASSQAPTPVNDPAQALPYKSKAPVLEMHLVNQLSRDEQDTLKSRHKDAEVADKKAYELDKEIMDYREKAEFYRLKLQEIILFKSRCENRLGEITERAAADKREMESLAKKYDERFKAAGETNSRLRAEEAAFRDIQERKIELYNAIAKMEQGGDANGLLQSKADKIFADLDELKKALSERARRLGLSVKATAPTEQQFGWQPGIQERAVEWDEDWDKFDDEGFVSIHDLMDDATGGTFTASAAKPSASWSEGDSHTDNFDSPGPRPNLEVSKEIPSSGAVVSNNTSPRADSEGSGSPSTSTSRAVERNAADKPVNANKASQRYANLTESQEDVFNGPPSYSSTTNSDVFGDGAWSAAFSHDDEVDSGVRASWGLQSNPPSTQASFDVTSSRTSRFGRADSSLHGAGDSLNMSSLNVSSPGRVPDVSSPTLSHRGNGNYRDSDDFDRYGSLGSSKDFDRSPKVPGNSHNPNLSNTLFDSPRKHGVGNDASYARFDSFSSPVNSPTFPRFGDEHQDHSFTGTGKDHVDRSFARFDSFSSVKGDGGVQGRPSSFGAFDDGDDFFAGSSPFTARTKEKNSDHGWSAF